jgi:rod shape-determining protein MreC
VRAFFLAFAALVLWFSDQRGVPVLEQTRSVLARILYPVIVASASPAHVIDASKQFVNRKLLAADNLELRQQVLQLRAQLLKFQALDAENARLRRLLASARVMQDKTMVAEVFSVSQDPYLQQISINKGSQQGVFSGQALVDAYGIVGQVVRVHPTHSVALLITDASHGIPVEVNRTGLQTIARGGGGKDGSALTLPFLPGNADVQPGDLLVTSGLGGRFPPGYPVGEVFDVKRGTAVHFMQASVAPAARLYQSREVLLVWAPQTLAPPPAGVASKTEVSATTPPPLAQYSLPLRPPVGAATPAATAAAVAESVKSIGNTVVGGSLLPEPNQPKPPTAAALAAQAMGVAPGPTGGPQGLPAPTPPIAATAPPTATGSGVIQPRPLPRRSLPRLNEASSPPASGVGGATAVSPNSPALTTTPPAPAAPPAGNAP